MSMERYGIDAAAAFGLLRKLSQESNAPSHPWPKRSSRHRA